MAATQDRDRLIRLVADLESPVRFGVDLARVVDVAEQVLAGWPLGHPLRDVKATDSWRRPVTDQPGQDAGASPRGRSPR